MTLPAIEWGRVATSADCLSSTALLSHQVRLAARADFQTFSDTTKMIKSSWSKMLLYSGLRQSDGSRPLRGLLGSDRWHGGRPR
jgi:hypothetical protein